MELEWLRQAVCRYPSRPGLLPTARCAEHRCDAAVDHYREALRLGHGPAGNGFVHGTSAMAIFAGLDSEFLDACVAAAGLAVSARRPEPVLAPLRLAASMAPLHEPVHAGLVSALGAAGHQAEALSVFRAIRDRLGEELGIGPAAALQSAHRRVLEGPTSATETTGGRDRRGEDAGRLVGRAEELAVLRRAVAAATDCAVVTWFIVLAGR